MIHLLTRSSDVAVIKKALGFLGRLCIYFTYNLLHRLLTVRASVREIKKLSFERSTFCVVICSIDSLRGAQTSFSRMQQYLSFAIE